MAPPGHGSAMSDMLHDLKVPQPAIVRVIEGGAQRADSVAAGVAALSADVGIVLIHDAARALTPVKVFEDVINAVRAGHSAVVPVVPVTDTIKEVAPRVVPAHPGSGVRDVVVRTIDRANLRAAQTPQGFLRETLAHAHAHASAATHEVGTATDDAGMVEALGGTVFIVAGDLRSMKITTPHDLAVAEVLLAGAP